MNRLQANVLIAILIAGGVATGCHKSVSAQNQPGDLGPDPAAANMAPADGSDAQQPPPAGQGTNEAITAAQTASPNDQPPPDQTTDQNVDQGYAAVDDSNDVDYSDAAAQADQAPPPLPDYDQPPLPGDGYIWTPGYWAWSPDAGYYWVPGAWVMPPYEGALWTPCWWGFHGGSYFFFSGYWGPYVGYYGGINYGFGYIGRGYEGGYWHANHFQYNRNVNIIRINIGNVYSHPVQAPAARFSYNGPGGARLRPAPAELNAMRQPHRVAPMSTQVQMQRDAQQNRAQFANQNHGRPAAVVAPRPIQADRKTQALPPARIPQPQPQQQQRPGNQMQGPQNNQPRPQQGQQRPTQPAAPIEQRPQPRPQPAPQQQPQRPAQQQPQQQQRPENFNRPAQPAPAQPQSPQQPPRQFQMQQRPEQQQQFTPQPRPEPAPQPRPEPAPRPQPAPQPRPAPQARPAPAPQPHNEPAPQNNGHDDHQH